MPLNEAGNTDADSERTFVEKKIGELRQRLLDLTSRNQLLNYRHPTGYSVRVVDELPDQVATDLGSGGRFTLEPVPRPSDKELLEAGYIKVDPETGTEVSRTEPKSEEWARVKGIQADYELPSGSAGKRHEDSKLQTLLFPPSLESRLRKVRSRAESAESEMGCHILFLAVGFLEWYESDSSDRKRLAPLYTVPVDLTREGVNKAEGAYRYQITPRDEDVLDNITLREKLANDFGLSLPSASQSAGPEAYFTQIEKEILAEQPKWRIHRYITLATLNFQKQAMYEDLNPARWGDEKSILDHELVRMFFTAVERDEEREAEVNQEYPIDDIPDVLDRYPVVFDADSSQHSAIVDALDGKNLVIEGPPGTGKSQTITNLIAACIAADKSVLFVAEKMAALDVVKSRLTRAGLGDFCLELHGHKAQKSAVLEGLEARLKGKYPRARKIATEKELLLERRNRLNGHAKLVNTKWRKTDLTPYEIFTKAIRYQDKVPDPNGLPIIPSITGETFTGTQARRLQDNTQRVAGLHSKVAGQTPERLLNSHYWFGVRKSSLLQSGHGEVVSTLSSWTKALEQLHRDYQKAACTAGLPGQAPCTAESLRKIVAATSYLPELGGTERLEAVGALAAEAEACEAVLQEHDSLHAQWESLAATFEPQALGDSTVPTVIENATRRFRAVGIAETEPLDRISRWAQSLGALEEECSSIHDEFAELLTRLPDSLHENLVVSRQGLNRFATLAELITALPRELWRHRAALYDNPDLDSLLDDLRVRLGDLVAMRKQLEGVYSLSDLPRSESLQADIRLVHSGGLFRWLSGSWRSARRRILALSLGTKPARKACLEQASTLHRYAKGLEDAAALSQENPALGDKYCGVDTAIDRITTLREWYRRVREEYGDRFSRQAATAAALFELDADLAYGLANYSDGQLAKRVRALSANLQEASSFVQSAALAKPERLLIGNDGTLANVREQLDAILGSCRPFICDDSLSVADLNARADLLHKQFNAIEAWKATPIQALLREAGFDLRAGYGENQPTETDALRSTLATAQALAAHPEVLAAATQDPTANRYRALQAIPEQLQDALGRESSELVRFANAGDIEYSSWTNLCGEELLPLIERNGHALEHVPWITDWLNYLRIKGSLIPEGLDAFIAHLEENALDKNQVFDATNAIVFGQLAKEILKDSAELAGFYGPEQDVLRDQFQEADTNMLVLKQGDIAADVSKRSAPAGHSGGRVGDYTERALIEHEIGKQRRHIAIRELLNRSGNAIRALKPCFMMSPMSVATHLEPGRHQFDIVVMDEASQIKPEDALGSIARASSLVIVGDPKQLPPTSFFDRSAGDKENEEDDDVALEESESILEAVTGMFPTRRLRWHYRSRHESLIAFSAENFYDNDLVLFPSPFETNAEFGVKFHPVPDGFFQKVNKPEAREVVNFLINQLSSRPEESVGVVAMSASQCTLIQEELEDRMKDDPGIHTLMERAFLGEDPPFIKNLESVQGDERDVIVISMTYGPLTPGQQVPQRFGPINTGGGWRRLNVLFTRAKKRMHVFSTMRAHNVLVEGHSSKGRKALRDFLAYCEQTPESVAQETGRAPDSDFEISVMEALERRGVKCTPQLGVAGYFLDLAVRHPDDPGRYLLGIECDGATYHSAKSARDRDRLRQDVLEGLGWKIIRVWSTDWFRNPTLQVQRLENAIRDALDQTAS